MSEKKEFSELQDIEKDIDSISKEIKYYVIEPTVELLVNKFKSDPQDLYIPKYQRAFIWSQSKQSKFIESLLMGIPIPYLFFWENKEGCLEIVDGSQRIQTLVKFMDNELKLDGLEKIASLNGCKWEDIVPSRQRKFKNRSIRANILDAQTDETARYDMFERINTGGKTATPAEVRKGALPGSFMGMIEEFSKDKKFKELVGELNKSICEDLVTRLFAYADKLDKYKNSPQKFLFNYVKSKNEEFEKDKKKQFVKKYRERFERLIKFVENNYPNGFKKAGRKATNNAYFEALAIGTLLALETPNFQYNKRFNTEKWLDNEDFKKIVTSDAANNKNKLQGRIFYVRDKLLEENKGE